MNHSDNRKKVAHVIYDLSTAGAQTVVMNYLRYMNNDDEFKVSVIVLGDYQDTEYEREIKADGYSITYCHFRPIKRFRLIRPLLNWLYCQKCILKALRKEKPDIIHSHIANITPFLCIPALLSCTSIKIHSLHSDPYAVPKKYTFWTKAAINKFGFFPICVTEEQGKKAEIKYGLEQYRVIHNGLDIDRYKSQVFNKGDIKKNLGIPQDAYVIGYVGSLYSTKNVEFIIDLFNIFLLEKPNAHLLIVGDGVERISLENKCKQLGILNKVTFTGKQNNVIPLYNSMDIFMLTSRFESSSIVTVEAQLCGVPCVVSDAVPKDVIISDTVNRLSLLDPIGKWIKAMNRELNYEEKINNDDSFSIQNSIKETKALYSELLQGKLINK